MGLFDSIKNILNVPDEDEFEEETVAEEEETEPVQKKKSFDDGYSARKTETTPRIIKSRNNNFQQTSSQMQMVLVRPDRFEDVTSIADHLNAKKAVVLNLEAANRDISRRIIDFLSGVAYANNGNMRKVANSTFLIVPFGVDVMGELMLEEFDEGKMYF